MEDETPRPLEELMAHQGDEPADEGEPKRKLPWAKIAVLAVVAIVSVAAAWSVAGILTTPPRPAANNEQKMIDPSLLPPDPEPEPRPTGDSEPILYAMDSIIVNLDGTQARRYLKATVAFAVKNKEALQHVDRQKLELTDRLILLLSSKKIEDIEGYERKRELKREIRDEVNNILGIKDAVTQVFFADLIIQ
jgi:flagellar basal body-associated protein FliL